MTNVEGCRELRIDKSKIFQIKRADNIEFKTSYNNKASPALSEPS